jgi:mono/diheme cytochrome c family protein
VSFLTVIQIRDSCDVVSELYYHKKQLTMKNTRQTLLIVPMIALSLFAMAFRGSFQQTKPMAVFAAPASADAVKNPLKGDAAATTAGQALYKKQCAMCHGDKGKGDGIAAASLSKPPANHTSAMVQKISDGGLFWMITTGNNPMPSYKTMTETQRWQLVNYIRTLAAAPKK